MRQVKQGKCSVGSVFNHTHLRYLAYQSMLLGFLVQEFVTDDTFD